MVDAIGNRVRSGNQNYPHALGNELAQDRLNFAAAVGIEPDERLVEDQHFGICE